MAVADLWLAELLLFISSKITWYYDDDDEVGDTDELVRDGATKTEYVLEQESKEYKANTKQLEFGMIDLNLNQAKRYYDLKVTFLSESKN